MNLRDRAEAAAAGVFEALAASPTEEQARKATDRIEKVLIDVMIAEGKRCAEVAGKCCGPDQDLARNVARTVRLSNEALIANLSALR